MFTFELNEIETRILHDNGIINAEFILDRWESGTDNLGTSDYGDYEAKLKESPEVMTGDGFMEKYDLLNSIYDNFEDMYRNCDGEYVAFYHEGNTYKHADLDVTNKQHAMGNLTKLDLNFLAFRLHRYGDVRGNYTQWYVIEYVDEYGALEILSGGYITGHIEFTDGTEATIDAQQSSDVYYWRVNERHTDDEGQAGQFKRLSKMFDSWNFDEVIFDMLLHGSYETEKLDPLTEAERELEIARTNPSQKDLDV